MKVEQLMTQDVRTCRPGDSLSVAAQLMWDGDCGCIPVVTDDGSKRVIGMVTDRDICMATHFRGRAPRGVPVGEVMSTAVRAVGPSEELADAEAIMRDAQVRLSSRRSTSRQPSAALWLFSTT
jgi:CBS domain-containing protein